MQHHMIHGLLVMSCFSMGSASILKDTLDQLQQRQQAAEMEYNRQFNEDWDWVEQNIGLLRFRLIGIVIPGSGLASCDQSLSQDFTICQRGWNLHVPLLVFGRRTPCLVQHAPSFDLRSDSSRMTWQLMWSFPLKVSGMILAPTHPFTWRAPQIHPSVAAYDELRGPVAKTAVMVEVRRASRSSSEICQKYICYIFVYIPT